MLQFLENCYSTISVTTGAGKEETRIYNDSDSPSSEFFRFGHKFTSIPAHAPSVSYEDLVFTL